MAQDCSFQHRSDCPITVALEMVGDRWTLVVVRDLLVGKRRYGEFMESPENIPSNILADRLKRLQETGLVTREPYQQSPVRYEYQLTARGRGLLPVLQVLSRWSNEHFPETSSAPDEFMNMKP